MNALRHVHTLLAPGGTVVDVHPVTEEQVEAKERVVGKIAEPEWANVDLPNAEAGLRRAVEEGLYALEAETAYDVFQYADDVEELIEAKRELLEGQDVLVAAMRSGQAPVRTRMRVVMRRLRGVA